MPEETILLAHDPEYWRRTLHGEWTRQEERRSGFPWSAAMVERERIIMQGTLECALRALDSGGVAMNIAGGTHHAYADRAEGFCILNDFALASKWLLHAQQAVNACSSSIATSTKATAVPSSSRTTHGSPRFPCMGPPTTPCTKRSATSTWRCPTAPQTRTYLHLAGHPP